MKSVKATLALGFAHTAPFLLAASFLIIGGDFLFLMTKGYQDTLTATLEFLQLHLPFGAGLFVFVWGAATMASSGQYQTGLRMERLPLTKRQIVLVLGLSNLLGLIILWAIQLLMVLVIAILFYNGTGADFHGLHLFLMFYQVDFIHGLLPLQDFLFLVRLVAIGAGLSLGASNKVCNDWGGSPASKGLFSLICLIIAINIANFAEGALFSIFLSVYLIWPVLFWKGGYMDEEILET